MIFSHSSEVKASALHKRLQQGLHRKLSSHFSINGADTQKKIGLVIK